MGFKGSIVVMGAHLVHFAVTFSHSMQAGAPRHRAQAPLAVLYSPGLHLVIGGSVGFKTHDPFASTI